MSVGAGVLTSTLGRYLKVLRGKQLHSADDEALGSVLNCPVFVINLDRSPSRREFMRRYLQGVGIDARIFRAVDGERLDQATLARDGIYNEAYAREKFSRALSLGEIATTLSHLEVHSTIIAENIPMAMVLEDDIIFIDGVANTVRSALAEAPLGWNVLQLYYWCKDTEPVSESVVRFPCRDCMPVGALGYLITREGAKKMIAASYPVCYPADSLMGRSHRWGVALYGSSPPVITLEGNRIFPTQIHRPRSWPARVRRFLKHALVKTAGMVFSKRGS